MYTLNSAQAQQLADQFGTPLYVFDLQELYARVNLLRQAYPERVELCYAMKANPFLVPSLEGTAGCFEVCSPGEDHICDAQGIDPRGIVVSGVYKEDAFIRNLIAQRTPVRAYTVESCAQYDLLVSAAEAEGVRIPLLFRVTSDCQFGIDASEVKRLLVQSLTNPLLDIRGIQYFSGTQKKSLKKVRREFAFLDSFLQELAADLDYVPREVEYGPGVPMDYFEPDGAVVDAEQQEYLQGFAELLDQMEYQGPLVFEIGRGIASTCGTYITKIVDAKCNGGQNYAIVDGGMNHLVYYGNSLALHQPVCTIVPERDHTDAPLWCVCGALCSTNDILCKQLPLADGKIGDLLVFHRAGAYCMTEGISLFLSRDLPSVVLLDSQGTPRLLRNQVSTFPLNMEG